MGLLERAENIGRIDRHDATSDAHPGAPGVPQEWQSYEELSAIIKNAEAGYYSRGQAIDGLYFGWETAINLLHLQSVAFFIRKDRILTLGGSHGFEKKSGDTIPLAIINAPKSDDNSLGILGRAYLDPVFNTEICDVIDFALLRKNKEIHLLWIWSDPRLTEVGGKARSLIRGFLSKVSHDARNLEFGLEAAPPAEELWRIAADAHNVCAFRFDLADVLEDIDFRCHGFSRDVAKAILNEGIRACLGYREHAYLLPDNCAGAIMLLQEAPDTDLMQWHIMQLLARICPNMCADQMPECISLALEPKLQGAHQQLEKFLLS